MHAARMMGMMWERARACASARPCTHARVGPAAASRTWGRVRVGAHTTHCQHHRHHHRHRTSPLPAVEEMNLLSAGWKGSTSFLAAIPAAARMGANLPSSSGVRAHPLSLRSVFLRNSAHQRKGVHRGEDVGRRQPRLQPAPGHEREWQCSPASARPRLQEAACTADARNRTHAQMPARVGASRHKCKLACQP